MKRKKLPETDCDLMLSFWTLQEQSQKAHSRIRRARKRIDRNAKVMRAIGRKLEEMGWRLGFNQQHLVVGAYPYSTHRRPQR